MSFIKVKLKLHVIILHVCYHVVCHSLLTNTVSNSWAWAWAWAWASQLWPQILSQIVGLKVGQGRNNDRDGSICLSKTRFWRQLDSAQILVPPCSEFHLPAIQQQDFHLLTTPTFNFNGKKGKKIRRRIPNNNNDIEICTITRIHMEKQEKHATLKTCVRTQAHAHKHIRTWYLT